MEIRIDRGYKSYDVTDADGTVLGTVRLNLADAGLMGRFEEARRKIEAMVQDAGADANPDTMIAVDKAVKEQLDYAFGAEVSPVFFGGMSSLALCEDGELVLEKVKNSSPLAKQLQDMFSFSNAFFSSCFNRSASGLLSSTIAVRRFIAAPPVPSASLFFYIIAQVLPSVVCHSRTKQPVSRRLRQWAEIFLCFPAAMQNKKGTTQCVMPF